jgi:hypothetical protein
MFTCDCDGCGVAGHGCGVENPDLRVTRDKPYSSMKRRPQTQESTEKVRPQENFMSQWNLLAM